MNDEKRVLSDMPELLTLAPSPHMRRGVTTRRLMIDVLIALAPAAVFGIVAFGWRAAVILLLATASAILAEYLTEKILRRPNTVGDCSAAVTGLLLGMNLPSTVPFYVPIVGSVFAIVVVKQIFGGIGKNVMNPALAARVFLMLAWTAKMTKFVHAFAWMDGSDAVASATPLASLKTGAFDGSVLDLFLGKCGGCIGEVSALCLLIGGAYLLVRRVIAWQIPTAFLGTVALLTLIFHKGDMSAVSFMASSLFSGGLMLGAFFMATDYVTSPVTPWGRVIYGVGCGALVVFLRFFSGYPEGVSFAILIMNALVWYIELLTKPRVYGKARGKGERKHGNG